MKCVSRSSTADATCLEAILHVLIVVYPNFDQATAISKIASSCHLEFILSVLIKGFVIKHLAYGAWATSNTWGQINSDPFSH